MTIKNTEIVQTFYHSFLGKRNVNA
jgi:hypothetical protein